MPSMRTNLLRVEMNISPIVYEVDIACRAAIQHQHHSQITTFIHSTLPNAMYAHPYIYLPTPSSSTSFTLFLSSGAAVQLTLIATSQGISGTALLGLVAQRLMGLTELLYCPQLQSCFNPFQERRKGETSQMPGFSVQAAGEGVLAVIPVLLMSDGREELGDEVEVLLDYYSGNFYLKQNIVRFDKARGEVHFRDGSLLSRSGLRPVSIKTLGGFPLANELQHFFMRIRDTSNSFRESWGIKFDSRFLQTAYQAIHPGVVSMRGGHEKSLAEIVTPMSQHNWTHNWNEFLRGAALDDVLQAEIVILCGQGERRWVLELAQQLEAIRFRMGLTLTCKIIPHNGLENSEELIYIIRKDNTVLSPSKLYLMAHLKGKTKQQKEGLERITQFLIDQRLLFQFTQVDLQAQNSIQAVAYQQLCLFYAKFRLNPWKIKGIPFSNAPMAVASLHLQRTRQGLLSVSLIFTMNLFLTKFTAVHRLAKPQSVELTVEQALRQCISKFQSVHNRVPVRVFVFRTGHGQGDFEVQQEYRRVNELVLAQTGSFVTYICLTKQHLLRTFTQFDNNYISKDTCKRVQNLLYAQVKEETYIQLELEEPMHRIRVYQIEKNDPNFVTKILELTAKVIFGGVGNSFGRGLGLIDYAKRLNQLREYNLQPWKGFLKEGILPFL